MIKKINLIQNKCYCSLCLKNWKWVQVPVKWFNETFYNKEVKYKKFEVDDSFIARIDAKCVDSAESFSNFLKAINLFFNCYLVIAFKKIGK